MAEFEISLEEIGEHLDFMAHQGEDGGMPLAATVFEIIEAPDKPMIEIVKGS